jgi:hypothetical protein
MVVCSKALEQTQSGDGEPLAHGCGRAASCKIDQTGAVSTTKRVREGKELVHQSARHGWCPNKTDVQTSRAILI